MTRRYLKVIYDITGLSDEQVAALHVEAVVQAEESRSQPHFAGHPSVEVEAYTFYDEEQS